MRRLDVLSEFDDLTREQFSALAECTRPRMRREAFRAALANGRLDFRRCHANFTVARGIAVAEEALGEQLDQLVDLTVAKKTPLRVLEVVAS